jgi:taurine--2-oxoglutarate transaminase
MGGVVRVFDPYMYRSLMYREGMSEEEYSSVMVQQLEETIQYENPDNIAAMFLETVTGTNGIIPPPAGYLQGVRDVLTKYGILMVCDEVMCGLGRTGEWFAVDHWNVVPDILVMAKGLSSAFAPLGCVAVNPAIAASFDNVPFNGGLTYNAHPLCLGAAVANLKVCTPVPSFFLVQSVPHSRRLFRSRFLRRRTLWATRSVWGFTLRLTCIR